MGKIKPSIVVSIFFNYPNISPKECLYPYIRTLKKRIPNLGRPPGDLQFPDYVPTSELKKLIEAGGAT